MHGAVLYSIIGVREAIIRARARAMKTVPDCVPNGRNCVPKRKIVSLVVVCVPIVS